MAVTSSSTSVQIGANLNAAKKQCTASRSAESLAANVNWDTVETNEESVSRIKKLN